MNARSQSIAALTREAAITSGLFALGKVELRARAAAGDHAAAGELVRRGVAVAPTGFVKARIAAWHHAEPTISPTVERKLRTKGVMAAMLQSLKEGVLTPPSRPEPVVAPAPKVAPAKRDSIASVRKDMAALTGRVDQLAASVNQLSQTVRASLTA